jgi:hypothetical protein
LPFPPGEKIEVIVLSREIVSESTPPSTLKNTVLKFADPIEPVAESDWAAYNDLA